MYKYSLLFLWVDIKPRWLRPFFSWPLSPDLSINLNYCHASRNSNLHVYCWVQVWHAAGAFGSLMLTADFDHLLASQGWQLGFLRWLEDPVLHTFLLFCFRWNTGACSASAPSAGGRIKTQKMYKKQLTLTLIKDNPQTTQLPIERNELNHAASDK